MSLTPNSMFHDTGTDTGRTDEWGPHSRIAARPCPPHFHIKSTRSLRSSSSSCTCHLPFVVLRRRVFSRWMSRRWGSSRRIGQGNKSGDRMCSCQSHYRIINSCSEEHASHNLTCSANHPPPTQPLSWTLDKFLIHISRAVKGLVLHTMQISLAELNFVQQIIDFTRTSRAQRRKKRGPLTFRTHNPNNTLSLGVCGSHGWWW